MIVNEDNDNYNDYAGDYDDNHQDDRDDLLTYHHHNDHLVNCMINLIN